MPRLMRRIGQEILSEVVVVVYAKKARGEEVERDVKSSSMACGAPETTPDALGWGRRRSVG
jgi:hypothetical protein